MRTMELVKDGDAQPDDTNKPVPVIPTPTPEPDPIVSTDDLAMLASVKANVAILNIEIKTLLGFSSDYLVKKYKIRDQAQFDKVFGGVN